VKSFIGKLLDYKAPN